MYGDGGDGEARWWCSIWSDAELGMRSYGTEMSYKSSLMSVIFQLQSVTQPPAQPMTEQPSGHRRCQDSCSERCEVWEQPQLPCSSGTDILPWFVTAGNGSQGFTRHQDQTIRPSASHINVWERRGGLAWWHYLNGVLAPAPQLYWAGCVSGAGATRRLYVGGYETW